MKPTTHSAVSTPADAVTALDGFTARQRTLAFATLIVAFVMDVLDSTIVNVAAPAIRAELGAGGAAVQWMIAGYSMAFAMLLISGGRLGDILGYRRVFVAGMAGFTLASVLCGLAQEAWQLVAARLLQGAAAAFMGPQVLALAQLLFSPRERVKALSLFGVLGGLTAVLGPMVGGALVEADIAGLGWRSIFLINAPVGLAGLVAARLWLPAGGAPGGARLDPVGNLLAVALVCALVVPLVQGADWGWPWWCWAALAASAPLAMALVMHLRRRARAGGAVLVDLELFRDGGFASGVAVSLVFAVACAGFLLVLTLALQVGLGLTPLQAGLAHAPFALGVGLGVRVLGRRLLDRLGRGVVAAGSGLMAMAIALMIPGLSGAALPFWSLLVLLLLAGLGMGAVAGPLSPIVLARVPSTQAGAASGVLKSVQQLGAAAGAAAVGAVYLGLAHGAAQAGATKAAYAPTAIVLVLLLALSAVLSRRMPKALFD